MKILVLQLARVGDIYVSWPALRALRRAQPSAEIHILTRPRFSSAVEGLSAVQKVIHLPTTEILGPVAQENSDVQKAFGALSEFVDQLHAEKYDWILNFSFSPFSSYLTHYISHEQTRVSGYTRHTDGFLAIPDDISAYFYAQVGVGRPNRFHLIELFASMTEQDLQPEDWRGPSPFPTTNKILPAEYIVVHVGASEQSKVLSPAKWCQVLQDLRAINPVPIVLIGSPDEEDISLKIVQTVGERELYNYVGKTELTELFPILKRAKLLLGCDSAPIHMCSLTNTPVVNISLSTVNFWETGPRSLESLVIRAKNEQELSSEKVATVVHRCLLGEKQDLGVVHVVAGTPSYWTLSPKDADFDWFFLRALYLGDDFPSADDPNFREAIKQLRDINSLMVQQMETVEKAGNVAAVAPFIERGEEIIETIGKLVPCAQNLVRWYQTEKIRIAPGEMLKVLNRTIEIHKLLHKVLDLYWAEPAQNMKEAR